VAPRSTAATRLVTSRSISLTRILLSFVQVALMHAIAAALLQLGRGFTRWRAPWERGRVNVLEREPAGTPHHNFVAPAQTIRAANPDQRPVSKSSESAEHSTWHPIFQTGVIQGLSVQVNVPFREFAEAIISGESGSADHRVTSRWRKGPETQ
jgi:hypothetical protein